MRIPDFIIGGAPRSGTTWLYTLLSRHPEIFMANPVAPEPKFFLVNEIYAKGLAYYSALFSEAQDSQIVGEKTTNYLESSHAAQRIHKHLPKVKLIFIFRDPVARAYSNYLWSRQNGLEKEEFSVALDLEESRERNVPETLRYARPHAYFSRGLYADMLIPYQKLFSPAQMLYLRYEDIQEIPKILAGKVHRFLGVTQRPEDISELGKINATKNNQPTLPPEIRGKLIEAYSRPNKRLAELLGDDSLLWEYK